MAEQSEINAHRSIRWSSVSVLETGLCIRASFLEKCRTMFSS